LQLVWRDWLVLAEAWWMLLGFRLALQWMQFARLEAFTHPAAGIASVPPGALAFVRRMHEFGQPGGACTPAGHDVPAARPDLAPDVEQACHSGPTAYRGE
jgi:hypothetical protein